MGWTVIYSGGKNNKEAQTDTQSMLKKNISLHNLLSSPERTSIGKMAKLQQQFANSVPSITLMKVSRRIRI